MALREIDDRGRMHDVGSLEYHTEFNQVWYSFTSAQRDAMVAEIDSRLDQLISSPDPNWGSITNTSIEGGRTNLQTGIKGDWTGTVFQPIYDHLGDEGLAGMFYGKLWKMVIIDREERWIGVRSDPTFPQRGITLQGKTYFLDTNP
ncbi:MAG TPA: hypothetical protein VD837_14450 [Terriglobales bacterium]|nr:hypothetical protein [Terriglobales bacterium]